MQPEGRILLVEDESDWLRKLKAYLADEPYSIKVAEDFQKAANLLRDHVFDTVLVDLRCQRGIQSAWYHRLHRQDGT